MLTLLLSITVVFPVLYTFCGGVRVTGSATHLQIPRDYLYLVLFSMGNLFQGYPGLEAITDLGKQVQIIQQFFGVMMIGLLGFVLGKKITQS
jgi:predicted amino acid racemase